MQHKISIATNLYISRENWRNATSPKFIQFYILEYIINILPISYKQIRLFILEIEDSLVNFQELELLLYEYYNFINKIY